MTQAFSDMLKSDGSLSVTLEAKNISEFEKLLTKTAQLSASAAMEVRELQVVDGRMITNSNFDLWAAARQLARTKYYGRKVKGGGFELFTEGDIFLMISAGARVGFDPVQSMEHIMLVDGKTTIYGRGARALLLKAQTAGLITDWTEEFEGLAKDNSYTDATRAVVRIHRKGVDDPFVGSFSVAEAKAAGLIKADKGYGPWAQYTKDMLLWRAFHRAALGYADVLGGLTVFEALDVEDMRGGRPMGEPAPIESVGALTKLRRVAEQTTEKPEPADKAKPSQPSPSESSHVELAPMRDEADSMRSPPTGKESFSAGDIDTALGTTKK